MPPKKKLCRSKDQRSIIEVFRGSSDESENSSKDQTKPAPLEDTPKQPPTNKFIPKWFKLYSWLKYNQEKDFMRVKMTADIDYEQVIQIWRQKNRRLYKAKMLMPKKNRVAIYEYLFKEGVLVAKKDFSLPKHPEIAVPNLHVIKALTSLKSRGYVTEQFAWRHFYWYLTNEGIQYLRDFLHLPAEIVPATLKRQTRPETARPRPKEGYDGPQRPDRGQDRQEYRKAGGPPGGDKKADAGAGAGGEFQFRGGAGSGAGRGGFGRGRGFGAPSGPPPGQ